jgi:hypothetical protein
MERLGLLAQTYSSGKIPRPEEVKSDDQWFVDNCIAFNIPNTDLEYLTIETRKFEVKKER